MNLLLKGAVDDEMLDKLVKAYNDIEEKGGPLHIFFDSEGGSVTTGEAIIELINRYAQVTTFTVSGMIASMGFIIFAKISCIKTMLDSSFAILHLARWGTQILEGGKPLDDFSKFKEMQMRRGLKKTIEFYELLGLKEDEIELMRAGKDLHFDAVRVRKMLKLK